MSSLFSDALWDLVNSRPVHSLIFFPNLFFCVPCLLPPFTVPCKMVLARPDERETHPWSGGLRVVRLRGNLINIQLVSSLGVTERKTARWTSCRYLRDIKCAYDTLVTLGSMAIPVLSLSRSLCQTKSRTGTICTGLVALLASTRTSVPLQSRLSKSV